MLDLGSLVTDLLIILAVGLVAGVVCRWLRVSVLLGYLLAGALMGPGSLAWIASDQHEIEYIAEAGVFLLLFSIGLEFSLEDLWRLGRSLLVGGSVQMLLVVVPVVAALWAVGRPWQSAVLVAAAVSFSSTVLVFKALVEWGHASAPHGRRAIGILLFQDAALVPLLLLVPLLTGDGHVVPFTDYLRLGLTSFLFLAAVVVLRQLLARTIVPLLAHFRTLDLVVLFTVVSLGGVTLGAHRVGLPPEVGAFAAGLIFSGNRWTRQIDALVLPFRETFAAVFFVSLGLLFDPDLLRRDPFLMAMCLLGLIAVKFSAATVALRSTGLSWHAAAGTGIGLAHVGEFAFVLLSLGQRAGVIAPTDYLRVVTLAIGTLILTPLLLKHGLRATSDGAGREPSPAPKGPDRPGPQAIVIGAGLIGRHVTSALETIGNDVCLIDLGPINLHPFAQQGFRTVAGDAVDREVLERAGVDKAATAVVCVPDDESAQRIVRQLRAVGPSCFILVRCRYQGNAPKLYKSGANIVVSEEAEASSALLRFLIER